MIPAPASRLPMPARAIEASPPARSFGASAPSPAAAAAGASTARSAAPHGAAERFERLLRGHAGHDAGRPLERDAGARRDDAGRSIDRDPADDASAAADAGRLPGTPDRPTPDGEPAAAAGLPAPLARVGGSPAMPVPSPAATDASATALRLETGARFAADVPVSALSALAATTSHWEAFVGDPAGLALTVAATREAADGPGAGRSTAAWSIVVGSPAVDGALLARHAGRLNDRLQERWPGRPLRASVAPEGVAGTAARRTGGDGREAGPADGDDREGP